MMRLSRPIAVCLCLLGASCSSLPPAELRTSHLAGTPASAQDAALVVEIDGRAVDHTPAGFGHPVASGSTLITGPANELKAASPSAAESLLLATNLSLPDSGVQSGFGRVDVVSHTEVIIPAGCTAVLAIAAPTLSTRPPNPSAIELLIRVDAGAPDFQVRAPRRATDEETMLGRPSRQESQTLRIPWPLEARDGEFLLALAPTGGLERPTLWRIHTRAPTADESARAVELAKSLTAAPPGDARSAEFARSIRDAKSPDHVRSALAFAALETGASLMSEVAALADDKPLALVATAASESVTRNEPAEPGWRLDRAVLNALAKLHADNTLDRTLAAALSARYGEVGRDVQTLARLAQASGTRADFDQRLVAEHLILLDDTSPALRVRAFDFLASRRAAPEGYDPLASAKARRAAIERHVESMEPRR